MDLAEIPFDPSPEFVAFRKAAEAYLASEIHPIRGLRGELAHLSRLVDRLRLQQTELAGAELACDETAQLEDELRFECRMVKRDAHAMVVAAERYVDLDRTVQAVERGEIGYAHFLAMARLAKRTGGYFDQGFMLEQARRMTPGRFHYYCDEYAQAMDAEDALKRLLGQRSRRSLKIKEAEDGMVLVNGVFDPVDGSVIKQTLEPLAKKAGADDDRTKEQRMADALVQVLYSGQTPEVVVTTPVERLTDLEEGAAPKFDYSIVLPESLLFKLGCDCSLRPVFTEGEDVVNVGRSESPRMRKARQIRDGGCIWPGCDMPAKYKTGHHLVHWADGGTTDLQNLVSLCYRHHDKPHLEGYTFVTNPDGGWLPVPGYQRNAFGP